ncbi:MAG: hypothetical protein C9356_15095 [Oleiphilus sp.]|nr:MAG: hypothetical protein C9356_15095 [Oleiphilus sp.]
MTSEVNAAAAPAQASELHDIIGRVEDATALLSTLLRRHAYDAQVFTLPRVSRDEEAAFLTNEARGDYPYTAVTPVTGDDAIAQAAQSYGRFHGDPDLSGRFVYRLPGYIAVRDAKGEILETIRGVNTLRAHLEKRALSITDRNMRWDSFHTGKDYRIALQCTRSVLFFDQPVYSVGFSWVQKRSSTPLSYAEVQKKIHDSIRIHGPTQNAGWHVAREQELEALSKVPSTAQFVLRRTLRPRPMCNLRTQDRQAFQRDGYLPIILLNAEPPFKVSPLKDYDPGRQKRKPRANQARYHLISSYYHLYMRER